MISYILAGVVGATLATRALEAAADARAAPPAHADDDEEAPRAPAVAAVQAAVRDVGVVAAALGTQAAGTDVVAWLALACAAGTVGVDVLHNVNLKRARRDPAHDAIWHGAMRREAAVSLGRILEARRRLRAET